MTRTLCSGLQSLEFSMVDENAVEKKFKTNKRYRVDRSMTVTRKQSDLQWWGGGWYRGNNNNVLVMNTIRCARVYQWVIVPYGKRTESPKIVVPQELTWLLSTCRGVAPVRAEDKGERRNGSEEFTPGRRSAE